jgi:chromosome segregation ATPase
MKHRQELERESKELEDYRQELENNREELDIEQRKLRDDREGGESELAELERALSIAKTEIVGIRSQANFENNIYKDKCETLKVELEQARQAVSVDRGYLEKIEKLKFSLGQERARIAEYEAALVQLGDIDFLEPESEMFSDLGDDPESLLQAILRLMQRSNEDKEKVRALVLSKEKEYSKLKRLKSATETALLKEKGKHKLTKTSLNALETKHEIACSRLEDLEKKSSSIRVLTGSSPTPRTILVTAMSAINVEEGAHTDLHSEPLFPSNFLIGDLHTDLLDLPLGAEEVHRFLAFISNDSDGERLVNSLSLETCSVCKKQRFTLGTPLADTELCLNEFSQQYGTTSCCNEAICSGCYSSFFRGAIRNDWWHNLETEDWLQCPVENCKELMGIRTSAQLTARISELGDIDVDVAVQM